MSPTRTTRMQTSGIIALSSGLRDCDRGATLTPSWARVCGEMHQYLARHETTWGVALKTANTSRDRPGDKIGPMVLPTENARSIGRYVLYGEIAAGGMATVHFGQLGGPVGFSRTVAIKRLHPQFAKDPEFVTMFLDEARLCGRIRHPNVVPTLDVVTTSGEIFIVMEY